MRTMSPDSVGGAGQSSLADANHRAVCAWARSGLMHLTGHPDQAPLIASKDYIGRVEDLCEQLNEVSARVGDGVAAGAFLLGERAALLALGRQGQISAGGKSRMLSTADGYLAVSLARQEDIDFLPSWLGCEIDPPPWETLARILSSRTRAQLVSDGQLLGMPVAMVAEPGLTTDLYQLIDMRERGGAPSARPRRKPLVLDFSSLWAGPLCAHLLGQTGARVIKVESVARPDGARAHPAFFDLLHHGHEMLRLDFSSPQEIAWLRRLILRADVVIEASRPRAFEQLGILPRDCIVTNPQLTWVSITAYGRLSSRSNWVGFGDDVAAAAGLVEYDETGLPCFVGDAIADPLTGIAAALGALNSQLAGGGHLVDVPMVKVAAYVAHAPALDHGRVSPVVRRVGDLWAVQYGDSVIPVRKPLVRTASGRAAHRGAHTAELLREFA